MSTSFYFTQSTPATTWNITHNLDCVPLCDILQLKDGIVSKILPKKITYLSLNEIRVEFSDFTQGYATLFGKYKYDLNTSAGTVDIPHAPTPVPTLPPNNNSNPFTIISIVNNGNGTATATYTGEPTVDVGDVIQIWGANEPEYNGQHTITAAGPGTFTFPITGNPTTPATGTLTGEKTRIITGIVNNGDGTATGTYEGKPISVGDYINIIGANQPEYNGLKQVVSIGPGTFTFPIVGNPASPATGPISTEETIWFFDDFTGLTGTMNQRTVPGFPNKWVSYENGSIIPASVDKLIVDGAGNLTVNSIVEYAGDDLGIYYGYLEGLGEGSIYSGAFSVELNVNTVPQIVEHVNKILLRILIAYYIELERSGSNIIIRVYNDTYNTITPDPYITYSLPAVPVNTPIRIKVIFENGSATLFVNEVQQGSANLANILLQADVGGSIENAGVYIDLQGPASQIG